MPRRPGTPRLLRAINDRVALELLVQHGPLTRAQIGELSGLSKVTASQVIERLEARGLVSPVGETEGARGPNARTYGLRGGAAHVAGVAAARGGLTAAVADLAGTRLGEAQVEVTRGTDPVKAVREVLARAGRRARLPARSLSQVVIGTPGLVDPSSGELEFSWDLPTWHHGLLADLRDQLGVNLSIENDVNLVAAAEQGVGAAAGATSFALIWVGEGLGMALVLDGVLRRGATGGAGEIGYLPVPGAPVVRMSGPGRGAYRGGLQSLVSARGVRALAREHALRGTGADELFAAARRAGDRGQEFLDTLASSLALGVAAVCTVVDPGLVVLAGEVGWAGGDDLAARVAAEVASISPVRPHVVRGQVDDRPVLQGALLQALGSARDRLFDSTTVATPASGSAG